MYLVKAQQAKTLKSGETRTYRYWLLRQSRWDEGLKATVTRNLYTISRCDPGREDQAVISKDEARRIVAAVKAKTGEDLTIDDLRRVKRLAIEGTGDRDGH